MTDAPSAKGVLFDVDGVLRVWEPGETAAIEEKYGLIEGTINAIAYEPDRFGPALLGQITDDDWRMSVTAALIPLAGEVKHALECVLDWSVRLGRIDPEIAAVIAALRADGRMVGLIANATDRLPVDLVTLGITAPDQVDAIVNSAAVGSAKPDADIFLKAAELLEREPEDCLYVGARAEHVAGAERTGMAGHLYSGVGGLLTLLDRLPAP